MEKPKENKSGLHKEISSIFDGVPIPGDKSARQPADVPASEGAGQSPAKPPALGPQNPHIPPAPKVTKPAQAYQRTVSAKQIKSEGVRAASQGTWRQMKSKFFASKPGVNATRQKVVAILIPVLFVILIVAMSKVLSTPTRKVKKPAESGPAKVITQDDFEIDWQVPELYTATVRDPMQSGPQTVENAGGSETSTGTTNIDTQAAKAGRLIVKGILYSSNISAAIISDETVHVGDEVLGATVVKINKESVEFEKDGKKWSQKVQR